jgi:uncharacterized SAM-binding protein YcdF (DUF218 family)
MEKKDSIIVLSAMLTPERKLDDSAEKRVERAVELFEFGISDYVVMNGGPGRFTDMTFVPRGTHPVHSEVMKKYATDLGVPEDRVLIEDYASDTVGEAYFVKKMILEKRNWKNNIIVTNISHVPRAAVVYYQVLGSSYLTTFDLNVISESDKNRLEPEENSLRLFLENFGGLVPGDSEAIELVLYDKHDIYSKIPEEQRLVFYPKNSAK